MKRDLISFDQENQVFHLSNSQISYLIGVEDGGSLSHLYFGKKVSSYHNQLKFPRLDRGFSGNLPGSLERRFSRDTLPKEYSSSGEMDYHSPATIIRNPDGSNALFLTYQGYELIAGKPDLNVLPHTWVENPDEAQTLIIKLADQDSKLEYDLIYTIYRDYPIIARSVKVINKGESAYLEKIASMQLDFVDKNFETITLPGAHANERHLERSKIAQGIHNFASNRGTSSHQMNPFLALVDPDTNEFSGDAYGFALVYSGNHKFEVERDQFNQIRLNIGINDYNFKWKLDHGDQFQTPEVLMTYSNCGLNQMSQAFHEIVSRRLIRSKFKDEVRPIVVNNWEATYFDFDEDKLKPIVDKAKELGVEMFVLDDGWFGHRDDDNSSLGDWQVYYNKFPKGLGNFIDYVHNQGLKFGLWFEPEMISIDSKLYQDHPDFLMHVPGRRPSPSRNQYLLDLGRKEVRDNIFNQIDKLLSENKIDYIKWDMNRHLSDIYEADLPADQQGEVYHRYCLGFYDLINRIVNKYPDILIEGCSGGGGRFDLGAAYYTPQIWTSDNTDAIARCVIQYGTSLVYPQAMMTSHVSVSPNEQLGRITPFNTRGIVAMWGNLGYELELTKLSVEDQQAVKEQIQKYKKIRELTQYGKLYRLKSPMDSNQAAWMVVSSNQEEAIVSVVNILAYAQPYLTKVKLAGLDPNKKYQDLDNNQVYGGDELMNMGLYEPAWHGDFQAKMYHFKAVE
ncbi:alpha-galactosidase [Lactobacillus colini]|uniref:Alpha-galactosidase n=1 Tax=Lactobacillus colini TaxID=1819254 RepID=A0ABS4MCF4_9LACO|nr:alpha-galactosidase [Lactobacillus colini]MBP2057366.1 alpha-galactosidase [Lactobacillus colini]